MAKKAKVSLKNLIIKGVSVSFPTEVEMGNHPTTDNVIRLSSEYEKFTLIKGNRKIDNKKFSKYYEHIMSGGSFQPIMVNEKFEIVEGQHRTLAYIAAGKPIVYQIWTGMTIKDASQINSVKPWKNGDFAYMYWDEPEYIYYRKAKDVYEFPHDVIIDIMMDGSSISKEEFNHGGLKLSNEDEATKKFEKLNSIKIALLASGNKNISCLKFYMALLSYYDVVEIADKLQSQITKYPFGLRKVAHYDQYKEIIDNLLNYEEVLEKA